MSVSVRFNEESNAMRKVLIPRSSKLSIYLDRAWLRECSESVFRV